MSCSCTGRDTEVRALPERVQLRREAFNDFVEKQLETLRDNVLRRYDSDMEPLRSDLKRGADEGTDVVSVNLDQFVQRSVGALREDTEDEFCKHQKWIELTTKLLDSNEGDMDSVVGWHSEDMRMLPMWNVSLQDLKRRTRPRAYRTLTNDGLSNLKMRDTISQDLSCLRCFVLKANSWQQLLWTSIGALWILWDLITIPLGFFVLPKFLHFLRILARVSFGYWVLDMPLHLIFGVEVNGAQELRPRKLGILYLRSWFIMDLMLVTIDAVILGLEVFQETVWPSARLFRVLRLLRLLRLLRVTKLQNEVMVLANRFLSTNAFLILKVGAGLFMMMITNHIIACCWFGVGSMGEEKNWIANMELDNEDFGASYTASLHWSLTQFTPATNNIVPDNTVERAFASVVILLAIGVFSSFIASISSTLNTLRMSRVENSKHYGKLFQFFNERNLSVNLYAKVKQVLRSENLATRVQEKEVTLFQKIPERLKIQLHMEMYMPTLKSMQIWPENFQDANDFWSTVCHRVLAEAYASPGQDVFLPVTDCKDVYLLESGKMVYLYRRDTESKILSDTHLCVVCLWAEWQHRGRLSAGQGMCYYIKVNCEAFGHVVMKFGGELYRYLQIFGILLVSEIEWQQEEGFILSDLGLDQEQMNELSQQADRFSNVIGVAAPASSPRQPKDDALTRIISGMTKSGGNASNPTHLMV
eukprot:symbB.v1.2.013082.t1/scaffold920.1/size152120/4